MRTHKRNGQKISVMTLGCSKNVVDSENLLGLLNENNFSIEENPNKADILVINTCGFIKPAKEESINLIFEGVARKHSGKLKKLVVMGCLSQRYEKELKEQIKDVDYFFGVNDIEQIVRTLNQDLKKNLIGERVLLTPKHFAYFKISEGCNHTCSFCAIPLIRGRQVSRTMESLITEAEGLAAKGTKELLVIAQDTTHYGYDIYGERRLPQLFDELAQVKGIEWIRLHYAYPTKFPMEFLDVMNKHENICNYIDMPLQHISDKLLTSMRRGMKGGQIKKLLDSFREKVPNITLRSTFIVGYPGETEEDFQELYDFLQEYQLDRVGVFTYSQEENTRAFPLGDDIPEEIKVQRREALMKLQSEISLKKNKARIGSTIKVLIDERNENEYIGRSEHDAPDVDNLIHITYNEKIEKGNFYNIKIKKAKHYDLYGELVYANPTFARVTLNTILVAIGATAITLLIAIPCGYYMARSTRQNLLLMLIMIPFWTNFLIRIYAWIAILGNEGFLNDFLLATGLIDESVRFLYNRGAVMLVLVYTYLPYAILPLYSTIDKFDFSLLEAARDLGATKLSAITKVLLPNIRGGILTAFLFTFIPIFGAYAVPLLVGGTESYMLGNLIADELTKSRDWPLASAISLVITFVTTIGVLLLLRANGNGMLGGSGGGKKVVAEDMPAQASVGGAI